MLFYFILFYMTSIIYTEMTPIFYIDMSLITRVNLCSVILFYKISIIWYSRCNMYICNFNFFDMIILLRIVKARVSSIILILPVSCPHLSFLLFVCLFVYYLLSSVSIFLTTIFFKDLFNFSIYSRISSISIFVHGFTLSFYNIHFHLWL